VDAISPAAFTKLSYAMQGGADELEAALDPLALPTDRELSPDERHRANLAIGDVIFKDLREFVLQEAQAGAVNLVVLQHLVSPTLGQYLFGSDSPLIFGFGISPELLARADDGDPEHDVWEMTGLSADFAPVLLIGEADLAAYEGTTDNVVAHELGHCLGLPHSADAGNLMTPGQSSECDEPLSAEQVLLIRQRLLREQVSANSAAVGDALTLQWLPQLVAATLDAHRVRRSLTFQ
jgi:hypothetical protein